MPESHVVVVGLSFADGAAPTSCAYEMFRGTERECQGVISRMAVTSCDVRQIRQAIFSIDTIANWERYGGSATSAVC